jgi:clan AA aspartic protease (TIGR02281 family)
MRHLAKLIKALVLLLLPSCMLHAQATIKLEQKDGVYLIPCSVNGLGLKFIFDTGASDVSISLTEAMFMLKNGYLTESDFIGTEEYQVATGEIHEGYTLNIRSIQVGGKKLENVKASVVKSSVAPLLLGQSAISQLGAFQFDYANNVLVIMDGANSANKVESEGSSKREGEYLLIRPS